MATNETQEQEPSWGYDVFLSYRGDIRHTFAGNLYNALHQKRFKTFFVDDEDGMKCGDQISPTLLKALEESRISIVVFSQNYAHSLWCLDELVKILERVKMNNQLVLPIFYDIDPSDVRCQTGTYGEAMALHESPFAGDLEKVYKWRLALSQIVNFNGWVYGNGYNYEYQFIEKIVEWAVKNVPRYNVFLSCSEDTRYSFTGFLYNALSQEGFKTFMNDVRIIKKSRLSIIIFSENYAYSSSCLDELVTILECMKMKNQVVWPIFYKVEPSDLRHLRNSYGNAMAAHENSFGKDFEKVRKWKLALFEVANLKGWHLKTGYEYEFIQKIVEMAIKI